MTLESCTVKFARCQHRAMERGAILAVPGASCNHRLLRQKAAKYHIRTQQYTKLHTQNMTQNYT